MSFGKLNQDGTLSSANKQHEEFVSLDLFTKDNEGNYYEYYQSEMVDGMYVADEAKLAEQTNSAFNADIYNQIDKLEKQTNRPLRELNSQSTSEDDKAYAQNKLDSIDLEIKNLRGALK
jgi:hypothetical protein